MRISREVLMKVLLRIGSILIRALAFYVGAWFILCLSFLIAEAVTGYTYPANPIESDYPVPVLFDALVIFCPYVFSLLVVINYDCVKYGMKNE